MKPRLAINGFGRIGRALTKINYLSKQFDLVAINDINPYLDNMAYLFKYDSTYGVFPSVVEHENNSLIIDGKAIHYSSEENLADVDWEALGVDIIIDSSGVSSNVSAAKKITETTTVQYVVITHSTEESHKEIIMGINEETLTKSDTVISNSICDANAISHILKWIDNEYGIDSGAITTLHPWLSYQNLTDSPSISQTNPGSIWHEFSLGRSSTHSLIPKNTTAMSAAEKVLPNLQGKIMSFSYRIPTNIVATADITLKLETIPTLNKLKSFLSQKADDSPYVRINTESLISIDYERESNSAVIDEPWLKVENGLIKVVLWYDNEWGYSSRAIDLAVHLMSSK
jgi:glyceraldehyde 3-phosphate dehydrogenase